MALNSDQKKAIAAIDYAAGLASIETGFLSFAIGAAASLAYYLDKHASDPEGWNVDSIVQGPLPSTTTNTGHNHNLVCEQALIAGNTSAPYSVIIPFACQVRPDWTSELEAITETYFDDCVSTALNQDMSTVAKWMTATTNEIPLTGPDYTTVSDVFTSIQDVDQETWVSNLDDLITNVSGFALTSSEKVSFINALQILQLSYVLWGS